MPRRATTVLLLAMASPSLASATPFVPTSDGVVLETVPGAADPASRRLRDLDRRLAGDRADVTLAAEVARADIAQSRRLGDPRFLGHAEAALAPWPMQSAPPEIMLLRAVILQSYHDFAGSIAALDRVLAARPANLQAWLTLASVHQVQADYRDATYDCGQFATHTFGLAPDVCTASVMALSGHAAIALQAVSVSLAENTREAASNPDVGAWAMTLAAEVAERLGDPSAERRYRNALAADGTDPYLLGAWADWLLDHGRAGEVIALLRAPALTRIDPLLLRLALAEQAAGDPALDADVADLAARFETSRLRGDTIHRREQARFELHLEHQPRRALATAQANWATQREPADARILLEAAIAAGDPRAAEPVLDWLRDNRVEDRRLAVLVSDPSLRSR